MALQTTAVASQWLSSDRMDIPKDMNEITALEHRNGVFCAVRADLL
jgi:hypothetical protein